MANSIDLFSHPSNNLTSVPDDHRFGECYSSSLANRYIFLYILQIPPIKLIEFRDSALNDLRAFPPSARRDAGHQLDRLQHGQDPDDWKPLNTIGLGVREIRIQDAAGAFRIIYIAKFTDFIYVLHCFQKKTKKTSAADVALAAKRVRALLKELRK